MREAMTMFATVEPGVIRVPLLLHPEDEAAVRATLPRFPHEIQPNLVVSWLAGPGAATFAFPLPGPMVGWRRLIPQRWKQEAMTRFFGLVSELAGIGYSRLVVHPRDEAIVRKALTRDADGPRPDIIVGYHTSRRSVLFTTLFHREETP